MNWFYEFGIVPRQSYFVDVSFTYFAIFAVKFEPQRREETHTILGWTGY